MADRTLRREDFDDLDDWFRHCHRSGIEPFEDSAEFSGITADGPYGSLLGAIYGHSRREFERSWEGWGESDFIKTTQFEKAYRAVALANCRGRVMNASISISWKTVGVEHDLLVVRCQKRFLERARKWVEHRGLWPAWVWVLERGAKYGLHSHVLMSLPHELAPSFRAFAKTAIERIVERPLLETAEAKTFWMVSRSGSAIEPQWRTFTYLMKGIDPRYGWETEGGPLAFHDRVGVRHRPQGRMNLKRCGVSRELDTASFKRWSALNPLPSTAIRGDAADQLYTDVFWRWFKANRGQLRAPATIKKRKGMKQEMEAIR